MVIEIGILNPAPLMTYTFRQFNGTFTDACLLADTFAEIEGRTAIVVTGRHPSGYSKAPAYIAKTK